jgi:hypothetical protein
MAEVKERLVDWIKVIPPVFERNNNRPMTLEEVWNYLPQHVKDVSKLDNLRAGLTNMYNHGNMNKEKRPVGPNGRMRIVYWIGSPNRQKNILQEVEVESRPKPKPFDFSINKNRELAITKGFGDVKLSPDEVHELLRFVRNFYALRDEVTPE